jgi:hypothetical protein
VDELLQFQHGDKLAGNPLSMAVAAGPYTLDDDLNYEPLEALVNVVIDERPDVLILVSRAWSLTFGTSATPLALFNDGRNGMDQG